jgi:Calcineurin-like phosphoesterase
MSFLFQACFQRIEKVLLRLAKPALGWVSALILSVTLGPVTLPVFAQVPDSAQADSVLEAPPENFTVAFIGDQGLGPPSEAVLQLVKREGTQLLVHLGDFDYTNSPAAWDGQTNRILGEDFPQIAVMGNHDMFAWQGAEGYGEAIRRRIERMGVKLVGDAGLRYSMKYKGIRIVMTTPGLMGGDHAGFIRDQFAGDSSLWRISAWHVNQALMQVGGKGDEAGWNVYEESRKAGAIIATAHEHSYSRTHLLQKISYPTVASRDSTLVLRKGRTFVFVSGLGGYEARPQYRSGNWWASIYTGSQAALPGALFATFHVDGNPRKARFQFKNIENRVIDRFEAYSEVDAPPPPPDKKQPPHRHHMLYLDPATLGMPGGARVTVQDISGRTLADVGFLRRATRIPVRAQGLVLVQVENPDNSRIVRKAILLP